MLELGAVILAGGGGRRLGGVLKADLEVHARTFLDHLLCDLVAGGVDMEKTVVVGPSQLAASAGGAVRSRVTYLMEDPPGSGPAAGLMAGTRWLLQHRFPSAGSLRGEGELPPGSGVIPRGEGELVPGAGSCAPPSHWIFTLACDAPYSARALAQLWAQLDLQGDGICAADSRGQRQYLLGIYRAGALLRVADKAINQSMRALLEPLRLQELTLDEELLRDVDTWQDLDQVRKSKR